MEFLLALPAFTLIIFGLFFSVFFIIWPIVLLVQCVIDKRTSVLYKILTFILTFTPLYPIPSFVYGAFVRKGIMSMLALGLIALFWIGLMISLIFAGGAVIAFAVDGYSEAVKVTQNQLLQKKTSEPEPTYKGYNSMETDDINVFEDGRKTAR